MKYSACSNRVFHIFLCTPFMYIWLVNLSSAGAGFPLYLLLGIFGMACLWDNRDKCSENGTEWYLLLLSAGLSLLSLGLNLSCFEPTMTLLSIANMAMSFLGGIFVSYQILLWIVSRGSGRSAPNISVIIRLAFVYIWVLCLLPTDSRYGVYLFCAVVGTLAICHNCERDPLPDGKNKLVLGIFAGLFSAAALAANYPLFSPFFRLGTIAQFTACFLGGFCIGYHVLLAMMHRFPIERESRERGRPGFVFALTVLSVFAIGLMYLFSSVYPGLMTRDSASTVEQIMGMQEYNNTMPFWHTVTVQPFLRFGYRIFGTVEAGIALFHCVQVLFMAACFGCAIVTLYQAGIPVPVLAVVYLLYAVSPYNIVYSVTLWKDVPFSGAGLLFAVGLYRIINRIGRSTKLNYAILVLGAIGFSLWRTNGWYAFLVTFIVMALVMGKKYRKLLLVMALVLLLCWVMINPVLDGLEVSETNLVEAFAVPMQQVARVVANDRDLTEEQTRMLSDIFWLNTMAEVYDPLSVDPVKFIAFRNENISCVTQNIGGYLRLYFELGIKYPADYLFAWVDETKGYWNAGYDYWMYDLGHERNIDNAIERIFASMFRFLNETEAFKLFSSVGFYIWGMIGCCVANWLKKREEFLLSIPVLVLVAGLWLGTPVFCEFRYAYPVMLTLPVVACATMYKSV